MLPLYLLYRAHPFKLRKSYNNNQINIIGNHWETSPGFTTGTAAGVGDAGTQTEAWKKEAPASTSLGGYSYLLI